MIRPFIALFTQFSPKQLLNLAVKVNFAIKRNAAVLLMVLIQLIVGLMAIIEMPLFEYQSDEQGHLNMARFVASERRLPDQNDLSWQPDTLQFTQPPLYYFFTSPLIWLADDGEPIPGQPNPFPICNSYNQNLTTWARPQSFSFLESGAVRAGYLLRVLQLVFAIATTILVYKIAGVLLPAQPGIGLCAAGLIAYVPALMRTTAFIGNDWPVIFIGAVALYIAARTIHASSARQTTAGLFLVGLIGVAAVFTKVTGWSVFVLTLPIFGFWVRRYATFQMVVIAGGAIVLSSVSIALFNLTTYGSIIGRYPSTWLTQHMSIEYVIQLAALDFQNSLLLADHFSNVLIPGLARINQVTLAFTAISIILLLVALILRKSLVKRLTLPLLLLSASGILVIVRNLTAVNEHLIFAPLRYLGPGIPALAIISAVALARLPGYIGKGAMTLIPLSWLILSLLSATVSEIAIAQNKANVPDGHLPDNAFPVDIDQGTFPLSVVGYSLSLTDTFSDGVIDLTLYLTGNGPPIESLILLELQADSTSCRLIPARGFRPNTAIGEGELIAAHIDLPYCGDEREAPIPVTLSWRSVSADSRTSSPINESTISLLTIPTGLARPSAACTPNLGILDNTFQIIKTSFPATIANEHEFRPSVNWLVKTTTSQSYLRVYSLTNSSGNEVARCQGAPRMGTYPTNEWRQGEIIYDDSCTIQLPNSMPTGRYDLWVGMMDLQNNRYLPHNHSENENILRLGTIVKMTSS